MGPDTLTFALNRCKENRERTERKNIMILSPREKRLGLLSWPDEPQDKCLECGIVKSRRHSWFCRVECEDVYVDRELNRIG